jgi:hypothetical protein
MRGAISMFEPSLTEVANAATGGERTENGKLSIAVENSPLYRSKIPHP